MRKGILSSIKGKMTILGMIAWVIAFSVCLIYMSAVIHSVVVLFFKAFTWKILFELGQFVGSIATAVTLLWIVHTERYSRKQKRKDAEFSHLKGEVEKIVSCLKPLDFFGSRARLRELSTNTSMLCGDWINKYGRQDLMPLLNQLNQEVRLGFSNLGPQHFFSPGCTNVPLLEDAALRRLCDEIISEIDLGDLDRRKSQFAEILIVFSCLLKSECASQTGPVVYIPSDETVITILRVLNYFDPNVTKFIEELKIIDLRISDYNVIPVAQGVFKAGYISLSLLILATYHHKLQGYYLA